MDKNEEKDTSSKPDNNRDQDEMLEEELEQVAGGLNANSIQVCQVCERRVAVFGMAICGACFREQNPIE
jgi:hypothetical protein